MPRRRPTSSGSRLGAFSLRGRCRVRAAASGVGAPPGSAPPPLEGAEEERPEEGAGRPAPPQVPWSFQGSEGRTTIGTDLPACRPPARARREARRRRTRWTSCSRLLGWPRCRWAHMSQAATAATTSTTVGGRRRSSVSLRMRFGGARPRRRRLGRRRAHSTTTGRPRTSVVSSRRSNMAASTTAATGKQSLRR